jgi:predicted alpha/beta hydrolase family esterase
MKVKELIKELKKLPQNEVVYYSNNDEFLDIDAVGHNPKEYGYEGFVILGKKE